MNRITNNALIILTMSGALTLGAFARSPIIIHRGSTGSSAGIVAPSIPGSVNSGPAVPGIPAAGPGGVGTTPGTNRPSVGMPGQNVPGTMTPVPGVGNSGTTAPSVPVSPH